jgi:threonine/homoserine/homoserine lactone efflux protein
MDVVFKGVISGIVLAFLVGPVFFTIIQTSIERGFRSGIFVAIGVSLSDAAYIVVSYLGLMRFIESPASRLYLAYGGGGALFLFGCYYLLVKSRTLTKFDPQNVTATSPARLVAKGFVINGLSPMVLFFWLATVGVVTTEFGYTSTRSVVTYFAALVVTVFVTDLLKAKLADKLRVWITPRFIRILNIVLGLVLVIFGGQLLMYPEKLPH